MEVRAKSDYLGPHTFTIGLKWTQISIFSNRPEIPKTCVSYYNFIQNDRMWGSWG